ncbi:MAG: hypothetical protein LBF97_04590 [Elusimicrobiota bacterium]|jgi:hypothetical protein|nr:hypothetical protein [Elusimicrobiota bacterium]
MTTILNAKCENNKVETQLDEMIGEIENCQILSQGKAKSEGIAILHKEKAIYLTIPIESMKSILDTISNLASNVSDLAGKVGSDVAASNGGGPIAPNLSVDMQIIGQDIQKLQNEINELKENLQ